MSARPKPSPLPLLLSPEKAADHLGVSRSTLRKLAIAGSIKFKRLNGRRMFTGSSLQNYVESLPDA